MSIGFLHALTHNLASYLEGSRGTWDIKQNKDMISYKRIQDSERFPHTFEDQYSGVSNAASIPVTVRHNFAYFGAILFPKDTTLEIFQKVLACRLGFSF